MTAVVRRIYSSKVVFVPWRYDSLKISTLSSFQSAQLHVLSRPVLQQSRKMEQLQSVSLSPNFFFKQVCQKYL
jgi:hypothetical protein